jgi:MFS family permease
VLHHDQTTRSHDHVTLQESIFAVMQLCSIYQWAKVSDVIGRRPVLFMGALGLALSSVLFGLSKSLAMVVVARCLGERLHLRMNVHCDS